MTQNIRTDQSDGSPTEFTAEAAAVFKAEAA